MTGDILKTRERAFEYEFCRKVDERLLAQLREKCRAEERQAALAQATGIKQQAVLQELDELGIRAEYALALSLYPLVHVAWCDGRIAAGERAAVLEAAEQIGHDRDSASFRLLESWLEQEPGEELFKAWQDYLHALFETLTPVGRRTVKHSLLTRAHFVAEAAGGILGAHRISSVEHRALRELAAVFGNDEAEV